MGGTDEQWSDGYWTVGSEGRGVAGGAQPSADIAT